jgi:hypothetical protein
MLQEFFLVDICLLQDRQERACCDLGVIRNNNEPAAIRVKQIDMAAGLADRLKTKNGKDLYYLKS